MLEALYPVEALRMSHFSDSDWVPTCSSALGPLSYGVDESYLTPHIPFVDPVSQAVNAELVRPRSSSGYYGPVVDDMRPRSSSTPFYPHVEDLVRTRSQEAFYSPPVDQFNRGRNSTNVPQHQHQHHHHHQPPPHHGPDEYGFTSNPLGIKQEGVEDLTFGPSSPHLSTRSSTPYFPNYGLPEMGVSSTKKNPVPIAPNPVGLRKLNAQKRGWEETTSSPEASSKRRRRSSASHGHNELNEEERLLLRLKDEENLPWKDIALRFQMELGKSHQVPALQMRYKRLREKLRGWTSTDIHALQQARDYWEKFKWDIISTKMLDFGCTEKWPAKYCIRKWEELHPGLDVSKEQAASGKAASEESDHESSTDVGPR
ncbi:MAG: argininosuccinate lyase [Chaenotheca gracillima]|nr:MAG: argininosuccinate lyase [Chaenotheca gracillima]